jgi:hypothetical protein
MEFITGDDKDDSNLANDVIRHEMNHHSIFPSSAPSGGRDEISTSGILTASFQNSGILSSSGPNESTNGNKANNNNNESNNIQNQSKISSTERKSSDHSDDSSSDSDIDSDKEKRNNQKKTVALLFQPKKPMTLTEFIPRSQSSSSDYNSDSDSDASKCEQQTVLIPRNNDDNFSNNSRIKSRKK